jgi:predicted oxidoreductase
MNFDDIAGAFHAPPGWQGAHFGVSNFSRHQFESLNRRIALATNQVEFSPLHVAPMFDETFDGLQDLGVAPMIWSPLAGGRLFSSDDAAGSACAPPSNRWPTSCSVRLAAWCLRGLCSCRAARCR